MAGSLQAVFQNQRSFGAPPGSQSYTTPGTYSWVAPAGVTKVSVVAVGGGAGGAGVYCGCGGTNLAFAGQGGGLGYKNNYSVTPGNSYTVVVGSGGPTCWGGSCASNSYFCSVSVVKGGYGGFANSGGSYTGCGGGNGGNAAINANYTSISSGGGGAGGYSGKGGSGSILPVASSGCGGGGGGGVGNGNGGGVGLLGQGSNGAGALLANTGGGGGSAGCAGGSGNGGSAGKYGGGGHATYPTSNSAIGGGGAVRIVYPGSTRQFPSTCVGSP